MRRIDANPTRSAAMRSICLCLSECLAIKNNAQKQRKTRQNPIAASIPAISEETEEEERSGGLDKIEVLNDIEEGELEMNEVALFEEGKDMIQRKISAKECVEERTLDYFKRTL